jgi:hypothetical protein
MTAVLYHSGNFVDVMTTTVAYLESFSEGGGSTNSGEDREQRERGCGGCSPLVSGSAPFANE